MSARGAANLAAPRLFVCTPLHELSDSSMRELDCHHESERMPAPPQRVILSEVKNLLPLREALGILRLGYPRWVGVLADSLLRDTNPIRSARLLPPSHGKPTSGK